MKIQSNFFAYKFLRIHACTYKYLDLNNKTFIVRGLDLQEDSKKVLAISDGDPDPL